MYTPADFRLDDAASLQRFVREHAFGQLCTCDAAGTLTVTHLPVQKMLSAIVGFQFTVTAWEGKSKWNQNQPIERRRRVLAGLAGQPDSASQAAAAWLRGLLGDAAEGPA